MKVRLRICHHGGERDGKGKKKKGRIDLDTDHRQKGDKDEAKGAGRTRWATQEPNCQTKG